MIYLIIPAFNEGKNLPNFVPEIARVLTNTPHEIVIINDGSADNTLTVAHELAKKFPIKVLDHGVNKGVAEAFRTGITYVTNKAQPSDIVFIMEGDGTSSPDLLPPMAQRVEQGADIVIASRYHQGGQYKNFPLKRLILSRGANIVFQLLFPIPGVKDYSIFYRAYKAGPLQQAIRHYGQGFISVKTFFANIEILLHLAPFARHIEEIPFVYDYGQKKGKSGMKIGKNLRSYLTFIISHAFRSRSS